MESKSTTETTYTLMATVYTARLTPAQLRALSEAAYRKAEEMIAAGNAAKARELAELAVDLAAKAEHAVDTRSAVIQDKPVTEAQLARRGRAVARAVAEDADDDMLRAFSASRWGSAAVYARDELKIAPSSLTHYRKGVSPCPRWVDERIRRDFPKLRVRWPKGVVD